MKSSRRNRNGIVAGIALMILSPLAGVFLYLHGMNHAFDALGRGPGAIGDPNALSGGIGEVLIAYSVGFGGSIAGLIVFVVFLVLRGNAESALRRSTPPELPRVD